MGLLWAQCKDGYYLIEMVRKKILYPQLKREVKIASDWQPASEILIEDKSSGQQIVQEFRQETNLPIIGMMPGKDMLQSKEERLKYVSPLFESGKVFFPKNKKWMKDLLDELMDFPNATHDDIVDCISQYLSRKINQKPFRFEAI